MQPAELTYAVSNHLPVLAMRYHIPELGTSIWAIPENLYPHSEGDTMNVVNSLHEVVPYKKPVPTLEKATQ
jgi:hypothetical protein